LGLGRTAAAELKTVDYVDPVRYVGDWYQIAHIPLFFEFSGPCACAIQHLAPGPKGILKVHNTCNAGDPSGAIQEIKGEAYNDDPKTNSKFTVNFHQAFNGTYWIIGLDAHYRYAVVSDANQYSLYILSKTPTLAADLYKEAVALAAKQLDTSKLELTEQRGCRYPPAAYEPVPAN
jgi:apolipoprotein D and lipocalin family protein